jgi:hypothetical protein
MRPKGHPKTGGRAKGAPNKRKANRELALKVAGVDPKTFLLNGLAFYNGQIQREIAKRSKANLDIIATAYTAGREYAKDAAPYCHARLAAIEHTGAGGGPIKTQDVSAHDILADRVARLAARGGKA